MVLQHSPAIGRTLAELGLVGGSGARAVAVVRGGHAIDSFEEGFRLRVADTLVLAGSHAQMEEAMQRLSPPVATWDPQDAAGDGEDPGTAR